HEARMRTAKTRMARRTKTPYEKTPEEIPESRKSQPVSVPEYVLRTHAVNSVVGTIEFPLMAEQPLLAHVLQRGLSKRSPNHRNQGEQQCRPANHVSHQPAQWLMWIREPFY